MAISSALGNAIVPTSYGFRNVIINGNFMVNQRAYASGSNLASGAYGFDRWKSNYTNTALTFTSAPQGQTVTISASGVIRQIIERANVQAGTYVLSWFGTATGRVYNDGASAPAYSTGPLSVFLDGTANVVVEFTPASGTATLGQVQLELGSRATPFERKTYQQQLADCQRYLMRWSGVASSGRIATGVIVSGTVANFLLPYQVQPRTNLGTLSAIGTLFISDTATAFVVFVLSRFDVVCSNAAYNLQATSSGMTTFRFAFLEGSGSVLSDMEL